MTPKRKRCTATRSRMKTTARANAPRKMDACSTITTARLKETNCRTYRRAGSTIRAPDDVIGRKRMMWSSTPSTKMQPRMRPRDAMPATKRKPAARKRNRRPSSESSATQEDEAPPKRRPARKAPQKRKAPAPVKPSAARKPAAQKPAAARGPTVVQLKAMCRERGITGYSGWRKPELMTRCGAAHVVPSAPPTPLPPAIVVPPPTPALCFPLEAVGIWAYSGPRSSAGTGSPA